MFISVEQARQVKTAATAGYRFAVEHPQIFHGLTGDPEARKMLAMSEDFARVIPRPMGFDYRARFIQYGRLWGAAVAGALRGAKKAGVRLLPY